MSEPRDRAHLGAGAVITTLACVLLTPVSPALLIAAGSSMKLAALLGERAETQRALVSALFAAPAVVYFVLCLGLLLRMRRLPVGYPGRARLTGLGVAGALYGLLGGALQALAPGLLAPAVKLLVTTPADLWVTLSYPTQIWVGMLMVLAGLSSTAALFLSISAWWLVPLRVRRAMFVVIDLALFAVVAYFWQRVLARPSYVEPTALHATRLGLSFLLGVRVGARLIPYTLDLVESFDFRSLVAARHLRAKKSGFLAAISFLSILAVSVSSCALTTTLSVMGGFRQDLKRKILGSNAHIVVDRVDGRIEGYEDLVTRLRKVEDVRGVSPYASGEVMISSASNLAGAVLRGIDVARIGEVSELPGNMRMGSLDYLAHPEKISHLPSSAIGMGLGLPKVSKAGSEGDVKKPNAANERLTEAIDRMFAGDDAPRKDAPENVLPGIVVGQELARSLRLYLGDEVNVVTPLGELGPTGPMPKSRPFRVAGIFYSGMYEYDMKFAYVTLASAQKFLGAGDRVSGIEVTVREPDRAQEVAQDVTGTLADTSLRIRPWQELNKNLFGALALEKLAMFIALGIAILVASFCIVGTLTLMVQEKGREVAVLKALGAADRAIVAIFVLEGVLIGTFGSLLGLAMGYLVCFMAERFGVHLNPEVYYIDRLPVHIDPVEFVSVGVAAVAVCLVVTIYPAQLASRLRPVDALRYE